MDNDPIAQAALALRATCQGIVKMQRYATSQSGEALLWVDAHKQLTKALNAFDAIWADARGPLPSLATADRMERALDAERRIIDEVLGRGRPPPEIGLDPDAE